jgi:hypothetical protein
VVELLLDSTDINAEVRNSLSSFSDVEYEYTGGGVFVTFEGAGVNIAPNSQISGRYEGLMIDSPELENGAEAMITIEDGKISTLEIWNHGGVYPRRDLSKYLLRQEWKGSGEKQVSYL